MKKLIIILVSIICSLQLYGQRPCETGCDTKTTLNISTGIDNNGNLLPIGSTDPNWTLMNIPPLSNDCDQGSNPISLTSGMTTPNAYTVNFSNYTNPGQWIVQSNSRVLSAINNGRFGCNNIAGQPFVFDRPFCLCKRTMIDISLSLMGDDRVTLEIIDDNGSIIASNSYSWQNPATVWNQSINMNRGKYRLRARVRNTAKKAMGFSISGSLTAQEPSLSNNNNSCCEDYAITVQKIIDKDCSGSFTEGDELGGANWSFEIRNSSNSLVKTITTDNYGLATATGLAQGNYTVNEVAQNGFYSFQENIPVSLSTSNKIEFLNFYNCEGIRPLDFECCESKLDIFNTPGTPNPLNTEQRTENGTTMTIASEEFQINRDATIPITELRVVVTDIVYKYNYESCGECAENPALWGSIHSTSTIGEKGLFRSTPDFGLNNPNFVDQNANIREMIWKNPQGAILRRGDKFTINYILPAGSNIPCCVTEVKICTKISWKDANCCENEILTCSNIKLENGTAGDGNTSNCECGKQIGNGITVNPRNGGITNPMGGQRCGSMANVRLYKGHWFSKEIHEFRAPAYSCLSNDCSLSYKWEILNADGTIYKTGMGSRFNRSFPSRGTFKVRFTPICGGKECAPCDITVNVT